MSTSRRSFLVAAGAGTAGVAGGFVVGMAASSRDGQAVLAAEADTGFCTDMSMHHVQALAMCQRVLGRDAGDAVQAAAAEVLQTQAIEVGTMWAWLADWGQSTSPPTTVMAWMGMGDGAGVAVSMMPGLASDDEMRSLSSTEGMARLASTQVEVQTFEIAQYDQLLSTVYS